MAGHRRFLIFVGLSVLAAFAFVRLASHDGTSSAVAAVTPEPPRLVTAPAEEIEFTQAKLVGSVNPHGSPTTFYFAWGTSYSSLTNRTPGRSAGEGTHSLLFYETLPGLEAGREYFFQLVATNGGGTSKGSIGHLVTLTDTTPPTIELSGALTEGLKEGTTEYPLHVHATDGEAAAPQSGVKTIGIAVDDETVDTVAQACPKGSCPMDAEWTYDSEKYPGDHEVTVTATDQAGNQSVSVLELAEPDGSISACNPLSGETTGSPAKTTALPGGGTAEIYEGAGGATYKLLNPPAGFDPLEASNAELEEYGYPSRPEATDTEALAEWEELAGEYEGTEEGGLCVAARHTETSQEDGEAEESTSTVSLSGNYSGFEAIEPEGHDAWRQVSANHQVAEDNPTVCSANAEVSQWVGLGGREGGPLIQGGTKTYGDDINHAFLNRFINGEHAMGDRIVKMEIHPKDVVYDRVDYHPGTETATIYFFDRRTHKGRPVELEGIDSRFFDGSRADFIDEAPTLGGEIVPLFEYGSDEWTHTKVQPIGGGHWRKLGAVENRRVFMQIDSAHNLKSAPGLLHPDGASFVDTWHHCHD